MRQQLRLRVLLPVAVLALLGAGVGAFAYGKPPADDASAYVTTHAEKPAKKNASGRKAAGKPSRRKAASSHGANAQKPSAGTALERALGRRRSAVVVLYQPGGGVDGITVREARAGAVNVRAGFLPVNVKRNATVAKLFRKYDVREAPAVLVFVRGPRLAAHFDGFADRVTVAQAVTNALQ